MFLHKHFKGMKRFQTYIKRVIQCVCENIRTHESEMDKDMFMATEIENVISEFPTIFPGLFDGGAAEGTLKLKTLEKCYKWFFTDDNVDCIGLLGFFELDDQSKLLRSRLEHTPEPMLKLIAHLMAGSESLAEGEVAHFIENKDPYVTFVS